MKIEFWSDIVCPWCGLTEHRLELALARFEHRADVDLVHRSFQTHPDLPREGVTQKQLLAMHHIDPANADRILGPIERFAESEGLQPYRAIERTLGPTDYAHELLAYATEKGLHAQAWESMFRAHFGEARNLWTIDEVVAFASEIGLDPLETRAVLEGRKYKPIVDRDQLEAQRLGATGTPYILIDGKYVLAGARDTESLLAAMQQVWRETRPAEVLVTLGSQSEACSVDGCE
ncbi:MAG TPA: DsbA family oxidoreductase [Devosia sp.]|nr:DsbA family oxidoreductase [Devosia sp.]